MNQSKQAETPNVMTVVLEGEIGRAEVADVEMMLVELEGRGLKRFVVDFEDVHHFDYRGVGPLLDWANVLRERGGDVRLSGLSPYLHAIFRSAGAADDFDFFAQADDAKHSFSPAARLEALA